MIDPTRIDIQTDPRSMMMEGVARHGNTPFRCPIISHIDGNLWQGGCESGLVLPEEIKHVVSLYPWEQYRYHQNVKSILSVPAYDADIESIEPMLRRVMRWIISCTEDAPTLVHCQAGLNRSGLLAALVLVERGFSPKDAISVLREKRCEAVLCNKSFESWVLSLEAE